jgi:enamine deaminase RidA (YjgF/YER057c/UK114 family)
MTAKLPRSVIEPKNPRLNVSRGANLPHVPGIRVGPYIFLSGMGPIDPETGERKHGPIAEQVRTTLSNMQHMLDSAGSSLERVLRVHVVLADLVRYVGNGAGVPRVLPDRSARAHGVVDAT